jgi:hypothetical protein
MRRPKLMAAAAFAALSALSPYTVNAEGVSESKLACAAAVGNCRDAGCIGGNSLCADLSNGTRCYTTIIIIVEPKEPANAA